MLNSILLMCNYIYKFVTALIIITVALVAAEVLVSIIKNIIRFYIGEYREVKKKKNTERILKKN